MIKTLSNFHVFLWTTLNEIVMFQEIIQIEDIGILHINPLFLDYLQFHVDQVKNFPLDIVIVIEYSLLKELHHA